MNWDTLLLPIVLSATSAYLSAKVALRQHRTSSYWNKKFEAYSELIRALQANMFYYDECATNIRLGIPQPASDVANKAHETLEKLRIVPGWLISEKASELIDISLMGKDSVKINEAGFPYIEEYQFVQDYVDYYNRIIPLIVEEAKRDLGLHHKRWPLMAEWMRVNLPVDWT